MHVIGNSWTNYVRSDLSKKEHRGGVFKRLQPPMENRVLLEVEADVQMWWCGRCRLRSRPWPRPLHPVLPGRGLAMDSSRFCGERGRGRGMVMESERKEGGR